MNDAMKRALVPGLTLAVALCASMMGAQAQQAPAGGAPPAAAGARGGGRGPTMTVTSPAFPDGGEVPMHFAGRGDNKSPQFDFHWMNGLMPADPPANLASYVIILHDIENAQARGTGDTLHWTIFNIPGSAKGTPEGLGAGDLPDGARNGPGLNLGRGQPSSYFGPGAGVGAFHHYVFEFYALDSKLDLAASATREELMKAMDGHVIGKAAYVGRFHAPNP